MTKRISPALVLATLGLVVTGCGRTAAPETTPTTTPEPQPVEETTTPGADDAMMSSASSDAMVSSPAAAMYKDGSYTVVGKYNSPAGPEAINVTVTLEDGVVTDVQYAGTAEHVASKKWQKAFGEGFQTLVQGKKLDEIQLVTVSGSSLTPAGFMDALAQVKTQAK